MRRGSRALEEGERWGGAPGKAYLLTVRTFAVRLAILMSQQRRRSGDWNCCNIFFEYTHVLCMLVSSRHLANP